MHDVVDLRSDTLTLPTPLITGGPGDLVTGCLARKVKIHQIGPASIRCVTHKDVDVDDVARALEAFREITAAW